MGVQLNIKSAEARALAEEVAELRGESITQAVIEALRRERSILRHVGTPAEQRVREREAGFHDLIRGSRSMWKDSRLSIDHGDLLYDEQGLPR